MPLRRYLSVLALGVCLLVLPAASIAPPAADAASLLLAEAAPYLINAQDVSGAAPRAATDVTELYHLRFERVFPSGLSGIVEQRVFALPTASAADLFVPDDVWYDSARTRFQLVRARVLRGGTVLDGSDGGDLRPGATGNQPRRLILPRLRSGDRVELVYELLPDTSHDWTLLQGHFLGNLFALADSYPTTRARYVLAAPAAEASGIAVTQVGTAAAVHATAANGDRTWAWQASNLAAFFSSPDGPAITDVSPFVQVSGFANWAAMADWYSGVLARRAQLSPALRGQILALRGSNVRETVARVWQYLAPRLAYLGNESGIHAYVPAPVDAVFASGRGDCKDGALLLATWLRALGIEAHLALVRTTAMGRLAPTLADGDAPATMAAFDHALVYVPATDQWIDTTAPQFLSTELPASDQSGLALIVRPGQSDLLRIPAAVAAANLTRRAVRFTPEGNGWLHATGDIAVRGADAPALRQEYADPAQRAQVLQNWLDTYFPRAHVDTIAVAGIVPAADEVHIHFSARVPAPPSSLAWIHRHYATLLASEDDRRQPLELPLRWQLEESWSLPLASGAPCPSIAPVNEGGRFGDLSVVATCSEDRLEVASRVVQSARSVASRDYPAFRSFWQRVDATLNAAVKPTQTQTVLASMNR